MEEGGNFDIDFNELSHLLAEEDDNDDDEQEAHRTQPSQPGQASTPYHGGEQIELQTMQHEQTRLPSYAETSFGGKPTPTRDEIGGRLSRLSASLANLGINRRTGVLDISKIPDAKENPLSEDDKKQQIENAKRFIKNRFPQVDFAKRGPFRYSYKNPFELIVIGPKGGETPFFLKDGSDLRQKALNVTFVKRPLGPRGDVILAQKGEDIRKRQTILAEMRPEKARYLEQKDANEKEELDLKRSIELKASKKSQLEDHPDADKEEIKRKDQLIKHLNKDFKPNRKKMNSFKKITKMG